MWFRNLQVYSLDADWTLSPGGLEEALAAHPLQPCPPLAMTSQGWVAPADTPALVQNLDRHLLLALGVEQKLLPASVVAEAAQQYAEQWEQSHGIKPGRKLKREFKDRATTELLPRAFARRRVTHLWIDASARRLVVDSASAGPAELATETLRDTLGELPLSLPAPERAIDDTLSTWLRTDRPPETFALGEDCELTGPDETRPTLRYQRHPLQTPELHQHLDNGFRVSRLALTWRDQLSFVIDSKLQLKQLRFLDLDEADDETELTPEQRFEAEFALMSSSYSAMLGDLLGALGVVAAA
ncbi:MAG TPA: recombination-associated protein RdgC [Nevskiaceae bacterium]|nr:recombination-associated protein RdgC [Nevskiaceae bacterium]